MKKRDIFISKVILLVINKVMELFSQRKGLKPVKKVIQIDFMDRDLRNGLWNALTLFYWQEGGERKKLPIYLLPNKLQTLIKILWLDYFKAPIDTLGDWSHTYEKIRDYFFYCEWFEVYDFIEFVANNYPEDETNQKFMNFCNYILERELSAIGS